MHAQPTTFALAVAVLLTGGFAGCLSDEKPNADRAALDDAGTWWQHEPAWAVAALHGDDDPRDTDYIPSHDHFDLREHQGRSTANFHLLGHDPMVTSFHGTPAGTYYCGANSLEGERRYAVAASFSSGTAITVVDVTDPVPVMVGELNLPNTFVYDTAISPDGQYAVLGTWTLTTSDTGRPVTVAASTHDEYQTRTTWTDACGTTRAIEDNVPYDAGVVLVDLSDPAAPRVIDYAPQPTGAHSVSISDIDGTTMVAASITNLAYTASYWSFWTLEATAAGTRLAPYGVWSAHWSPGLMGVGQIGQASGFGGINGHMDATVQVHPVTGQTIAYLANWDGGFDIVQLDGPGMITPLASWGAWNPDAGDQMSGMVHTAYPLPQLWDGRHITVTGQELLSRPSNRPTGEIVLLDTTDPANPTPVARWTLPVDVQWSGGASYSTHYVAVVNETLFTSVYHGGVWAADASPEHWPELPSTGVFLPANATEGDPPRRVTSPLVQEVMAEPDGTLLILDANSGIYRVAFDAEDSSIPPATPWTKDAWITG